MRAAVFDTNVLVSAWLWRGTPLQALHAAHQRLIRLYTSQHQLNELTDVLRRPTLASDIAARGVSVSKLIDGFTKLAGIVNPVSIPRVARDPKDDHILACAAAARADFIVSGDRDLLVLRRHQGIDILTPRQILEHLGLRTAG
jgi:putative PIN family toxin of toxin-antitoxin system